MKYYNFKRIFEHLWDILFPYTGDRNPLLMKNALLPMRITTHLLQNSVPRDTYPLIALSDYSDRSIATLIHAFKYHRDVRAIKLLGTALGDYLLETLTRRREISPGSILTITTIPLSKKRFQERGFNQMDTLLESIALEYPELLAYIRVNLLYKKRDTPSQTQLSRRERLSNLRDAFSCTEPITGEVFLLDDVVTTGTTVREAAKVLKAAGAISVTVITLARKL
jgi:ComF family protein